MSTDLIEKMTELEQYADEARSHLMTNETAGWARAVMMAEGMKHLLASMTDDLVDALAVYQGKQFGFMTDSEYGTDVVRDAIVEALMAGVKPFGNEFNIIGRRMMVVKNGWKRKLNDLEHFGGFTTFTGMPTDTKDGTYSSVPVRIEYVWRGKKEALDFPGIMARKNAKNVTAIDSVTGKAERKALQKLYERLSGETFEDHPGDDVVEPVTGQVFDNQGNPV